MARLRTVTGPAMNGYQDLLHNYQPTEETQGR